MGIEIHTFVPDSELQGAILLDGSANVGLVGNITANYLIECQGLKPIGSIISPDFPSFALVNQGRPSHPFRIYGRPSGDGFPGLVVMVSEFRIPESTHLALARAILDWATAKGIELIVVPEGFVAPDAKEGLLLGIGTNAKAREFIASGQLEEMQEGLIAGISGVLLSEGTARDAPVAAVLTSAHADYPDARAAAGLIERISAMLNLPCDIDPLMKQAAEVESRIKTLLETQKATAERHPLPVDGRMYS